ncbi:MAG: 3D domain-containing protein [Clostridia bacterium]
MKKTNDFTGRKILMIACLLCFTSFLTLATIFNFQTFVIKYNNQSVMIKTVSSVSESQLFELASIDQSLVEVTEINNNGLNFTEITVYDTFTVNVTVDGQTLSEITAPTTLENVLTDLDVTLDSADIISVPPETLLTDATDVNITRVTYEQSSVTEYLDYQIVKRETSTLDLGVTNVISEGEMGELLITTETLLYDGVQVSEYVISEEVLKEPVTNIIEYGTFNVNRGVTNRDGVITTPSGEMITYSKVIDVTATAYTTEFKTNTITKSGTTARVGAIAVDPRVIPLGSTLYITSADGTSWVYGVAVAEDTGSAIIGNIIDLFFDTKQECISFGRQQAVVYVLS